MQEDVLEHPWFSYISIFYYASVDCMNSREYDTSTLGLLNYVFIARFYSRHFHFSKNWAEAIDKCISIDKMLLTYLREREREKERDGERCTVL